MPFNDTQSGQTYSCTHFNNNTSGVCDKCIGKTEFLGIIIKCDRCGYITKTVGMSCGVTDKGSFYGNHICEDGGMGTFYEVTSTFFSLPDKEKKRIVNDAAKFSSFCQRFKLEVWRQGKHQVPLGYGKSAFNINESRLDELCLIAFNLLANEK